MKTIGKLGSSFFCAFIILLIAGIVVLANNGGIYNAAQKFDQIMGDKPFGVDLVHVRFSDYDFNEADMDYSDRQTAPAAGIQKIVVEANGCAVELRKAEVPDITADFKSGKGKDGHYAKLEVTQQENCVYVRTLHEEADWAWSDFSQSRLVLSIPVDYKGDIQADCKAAKLNLQSLHDIAALDMDIKTGKVDASNISASRVNIDASAADIQITDVTAEQEVRMHTQAASMNGERIQSKSITAKSNLGNVQLTNIAGELSGDFTMGNAEIQFSEMRGNADIKGSMGSVSLTFPKDALIWLSEDGGMQSVQDSIHWTDGKYRMANAQYHVSVHNSMGTLELNQTK